MKLKQLIVNSDKQQRQQNIKDRAIYANANGGKWDGFVIINGGEKVNYRYTDKQKGQIILANGQEAILGPNGEVTITD